MEKLQQRLIELTLKGEPESVKKMALSQFKRMAFKDEDEFLEYLDELEPEAGEKESKGKKKFIGLKVEPNFKAIDDSKIKSIVNDLMNH